jgi:hypothetical protein
VRCRHQPGVLDDGQVQPSLARPVSETLCNRCAERHTQVNRILSSGSIFPGFSPAFAPNQAYRLISNDTLATARSTTAFWSEASTCGAPASIRLANRGKSAGSLGDDDGSYRPHCSSGFAESSLSLVLLLKKRPAVAHVLVRRDRPLPPATSDHPRLSLAEP